jgi:hypothetical protein
MVFPRLLRLALAMMLTVASAPISAQTISVPPLSVPPVTATELADGPGTIFTTPPTLTLTPHSAGGHAGKVWVRSSPEGLHVWARYEADQEGFRWPRQKSEMLTSDHVEVWLAAEPDVALPEIGYGNQFGPETLKSAADCHAGEATANPSFRSEEQKLIQTCELWYAEQLDYRRNLKHLFARQWLLAPGEFSDAHSFEDFAATAWANLNNSLFAEYLPKTLAPHPLQVAKLEQGENFASHPAGSMVVEFTSDTRPETRQDAAGHTSQQAHQTGYTLHLLIPYGQFPPAQQFRLQDLYLMVDVFSAVPDTPGKAQPKAIYSSTSEQRKWGVPATFNHLRLTDPRTFYVTPCHADPTQTDLYGNSYKPWFFPGAEADLRSTFVLENPAAGYMYEPASVSPNATEARYFTLNLAGGAQVCGPALAWVGENTSGKPSGSQIKRTKFGLNPEEHQVVNLPDGWSLVRSGPYTSTHSPFGSGQCGACEIMGMDIFAVSPTGEITQALALDQDLSGQDGNPQAADLDLSPDLKRVTLYLETIDYEAKDAKAQTTSTTYCLEGHTYKECGSNGHAKMPRPARFPALAANEEFTP